MPFSKVKLDQARVKKSSGQRRVVGEEEQWANKGKASNKGTRQGTSTSAPSHARGSKQSAYLQGDIWLGKQTCWP